jgi:hypothetical protein
VGCDTSDAHSSWNLHANQHASGTKVLLLNNTTKIFVSYKMVTLVTFVLIWFHLNGSTVFVTHEKKLQNLKLLFFWPLFKNKIFNSTSLFPVSIQN